MSDIRLALVGHPVAHSLSPPMHQAALSYCGLNGSYILVDAVPEDFPVCISSLAAQGFAGFNITVPHKQAVVPLCIELTDEAEQTRAVNTVKVAADATLVGHNTDVGGFCAALKMSLPGKRKGDTAVIIGAGGAARAALVGLVELGFPHIAVVARNVQGAKAMIDEWRQSRMKNAASERGSEPALCVIDTALDGLDQPFLVVNATTIGLASEEAPQWALDIISLLHFEGLFFDMVYSSSGKPTPLVAHATQLGLSSCDGTDMLVWQAALAFAFWTGRDVPVELMKEALAGARAQGNEKGSR